MSLYSSAVKNPISTALIFVAIAILGIFAFTKLPIDLYPHIESNSIMVMTSYAGASASDIESNVTKPIENTLNSVSYLKHMTSQSRENISVVTCEFKYGRDIDVATNDIRDKLEIVKSSLPDAAGNPVIFKFSSDDIPIIVLSVTAKESMPGLYKLLDDKVVNTLARTPGVGSVSIMGVPKREIKVYCDPYKLDAYNIPIESIASIIGTENLNMPAGSIDIGSNNYSLRVQKEFGSAKEMENIVVGSYGGRTVYLKDVAKVVDGMEERSQESYISGKKGGMIVIQKQTGANSVEIARQVEKMLPQIESTLPSDVKIGEIVNTSDNIVRTIGSLKETIFITLALVMLVVFVFLGRWRATLIIITTIPISLLASMAYLLATGNTLNIISMSSLSIAIGMVVDDAIVVLENVTTHIERGSSPKQAAVYATNEVALSVVASTLTVLAVFLPLTMISGLSGIMFRQLGWMVSIIMVVSLVCALALTPMMCSQMLRLKNKKTKLHEALFTPIDKGLNALNRGYAKLLDWAVHHRKQVVFIATGIFVGVLAICGPFIKSEFFPQQDNARISVKVELPVGTRQEITRDFALMLQQRFMKLEPEIEVNSVSEGTADSDNLFASLQSNGTNIINFNIRLCSVEKRKRGLTELSDVLRNELAKYPQIRKSQVIAGGQQGGVGGQQGVEIDIYGYDFNATDAAAQEVVKQFKSFKGVQQVLVSRDAYTPEYRVNLDREKVAINGLNTATVSQYLRNRINGATASEFREEGDEYDIKVRYAPEYRQSVEDIENITVYNSQGKGIKIRELGKVEESMTPPTIERKDRQRYISVTAALPKGMASSDLLNGIQQKLNNVHFPAGISWQVGGTYEDQKDMYSDLFTLMILIVLLVFIVMAAQFESLTYPFVIMMAVPFAFVGVVIGLAISGTPMSVMAMIGVIMLIGIVVKNGIVLVDYTNLQRERGMGITQAVVTAGHSRLRPVLMTTLTTVLGMIPLAVGTGEGSEMWRGMGLTVAWGLSVSTVITLVLVPTVYAIFAGNGVKHQRKKDKKRIKALEAAKVSVPGTNA